jgi:hypothetical protein
MKLEFATKEFPSLEPISGSSSEMQEYRFPKAEESRNGIQESYVKPYLNFSPVGCPDSELPERSTRARVRSKANNRAYWASSVILWKSWL